MKIKVSEATLNQLDWLVAKCESSCKDVSNSDVIYWETVFVLWEEYHDVMGYTTDWSLCGPIIDREGLELSVHIIHNGVIVSWASEKDCPGDTAKNAVGKTPLIAAMRCYIVSELGDEVEIPDLIK